MSVGAAYTGGLNAGIRRRRDDMDYELNLARLAHQQQQLDLQSERAGSAPTNRSGVSPSRGIRYASGPSGRRLPQQAGEGATGSDLTAREIQKYDDERGIKLRQDDREERRLKMDEDAAIFGILGNEEDRQRKRQLQNRGDDQYDRLEAFRGVMQGLTSRDPETIAKYWGQMMPGSNDIREVEGPDGEMMLTNESNIPVPKFDFFEDGTVEVSVAGMGTEKFDSIEEAFDEFVLPLYPGMEQPMSQKGGAGIKPFGRKKVDPKLHAEADKFAKGNSTTVDPDTGYETTDPAEYRKSYDEFIKQYGGAKGKRAVPAPDGGDDNPPMEGAQKAPDGEWYIQKDGIWYLIKKSGGKASGRPPADAGASPAVEKKEKGIKTPFKTGRFSPASPEQRQAAVDEITAFADKIGVGAKNWKALAKDLADIAGFTLEELYIKPVNELSKLFTKYLESQNKARKDMIG